MRWTLLDGSPRGARSNTTILLGALAKGLTAAGHTTELLHLARGGDRVAAPARYAGAVRFLLGFPLYTDTMPGLVKEFIEALEPYQGRETNPPLVFLVQSGFPEPGQSRAVEAYLECLAHRLGSRYVGTIVKGGVEGIQAMPPWMTRPLLARMEQLGASLGATDELDPKLLRALAGPDWLKGWRSPILRLILAAGANPYWSRALKQRGAYARRFERPYQEYAEGKARAGS
jgi:hypothetical protein